MITQKFKPTKTGTSNRVIDIPHNFAKLAHSWPSNVDYTFQGKTEYTPTNNGCNKQLAKLLTQIGAKQVTFHALRHTHASYLLANDIAIQYVSERLGHADVNITLKTYAHLLNRKRKEETIKTIHILDNL
ncbi:site-specific integrase [Eupransor demetentiae]|uniref:Includes phage integrase (FimB) n=1 Tax=Eupransor demetentiae TaxID=3109584 RepID=A0ABM9N4S4_9LACO|nr:Integrase/recombinase [Lactobacillaceae bacterium LMG 33000]